MLGKTLYKYHLTISKLILSVYFPMSPNSATLRTSSLKAAREKKTTSYTSRAGYVVTLVSVSYDSLTPPHNRSNHIRVRGMFPSSDGMELPLVGVYLHCYSLCWILCLTLEIYQFMVPADARPLDPISNKADPKTCRKATLQKQHGTRRREKRCCDGDFVAVYKDVCLYHVPYALLLA